MNLVLYIHGKGGSPAESKHYKSLFPEYHVIGLDYQTFTPWATGKEIHTAVSKFKNEYKKIILIANSIGAFFCMNADISEWIDKMTSPIIQLGKNFGNMCYGYLWYRPHKDKPVYAAIGDGGNVIYVNAEKNISVGVTGTFKPRIFDRIDFIENKVLPLLFD